MHIQLSQKEGWPISGRDGRLSGLGVGWLVDDDVDGIILDLEGCPGSIMCNIAVVTGGSDVYVTAVPWPLLNALTLKPRRISQPAGASYVITTPIAA